MTLHTLKTEADYKETLAELNGVFDAAPNIPEADRLDILALLIEACQEQHHSITAYYGKDRR